MSQNAKLIGAIISILILLLLGNYLASIIFSLWIDRSLDYVTQFRFIFDYLRYFNLSRYSMQFHVSAMIGFALPIIAITMIGRHFYRYRRIYGKSRFTNMLELRKNEFLSSSYNSVIVGKYKNKFLNFSGQKMYF